MGLSHSPSIVTNGLVLCLDAANKKSYSGTGTSWIDLSGNGNNGTLVSNPTYSSSNGGAFIFDGSASGATTDIAPTLTNVVTFETAVNTSVGLQTNSWIWGREGCYRLTYASTSVQFVLCTVNNAWYTTGTVVGANITTLSNWNYITATYDGTRLKIYQNGVLSATSTADISGNVLTNANGFALMKSGAANVAYGAGSMAFMKVYNRLLSNSEIQQNFNALRGRYGL